jgi:hypothetical protein
MPYPGGIPSRAFDDEDAKRAISIAEKIINFIKEKLKVSYKSSNLRQKITTNLISMALFFYL